MPDGVDFRYDTPAHRYRGFAVVSKTNGEICRGVAKRPENKPYFRLVFGDVHEGFLAIAKEFLAIPVVSDVFKKYANTHTRKLFCSVNLDFFLGVRRCYLVLMVNILRFWRRL